jgi:hypothetical protein
LSFCTHHSQEKRIVVLSAATALAAFEAALDGSAAAFEMPRLSLEDYALPPACATATEAAQYRQHSKPYDVRPPFFVHRLIPLRLLMMFWFKGIFADVWYGEVDFRASVLKSESANLATGSVVSLGAREKTVRVETIRQVQFVWQFVCTTSCAISVVDLSVW